MDSHFTNHDQFNIHKIHLIDFGEIPSTLKIDEELLKNPNDLSFEDSPLNRFCFEHFCRETIGIAGQIEGT
jgi:hypothetical protein